MTTTTFTNGPGPLEALTTLTVKKGASAASLSLVRRRDGAIQFTDVNGHRQTLHDPVATKLFDAINALV